MEIDIFGVREMPKLKPVVEKIVLQANRDAMHGDLMVKVRLNRYDLRFMSNIEQKYLSKDKPLSPGQNELYEKIVHKYRKQLRKLGVNYRDVIALPWENGIIEVDTLTQQTYFRLAEIDNNTVIQLYFNFNKQQIETVREIIHDDGGNHLNRGTTVSFGNGQKYNFTWNKDDKIWQGPFNVYLFKRLYEFSKSIGVRIERSVTEFIEKMEARGLENAWTPHVHVTDGQIYISHLTETMLPYLEDIDFSDTSVQNLERLTKLGLTGPCMHGAIDQYINSVSSNTKHNIMNDDDVNTLKKYVKESGRKVLLYSTIGWKPSRDSIGFGLTEWDDNVLRVNAGDVSTAEAIDKFKEEGYNTLISTTAISNLFLNQDQIGKFALEADKVLYISIAGTT